MIIGIGIFGSQATGSQSLSNGAKAFQQGIPSSGYMEAGISTNLAQGGFKIGVNWSNVNTRVFER